MADRSWMSLNNISITKTIEKAKSYFFSTVVQGWISPRHLPGQSGVSEKKSSQAPDNLGLSGSNFQNFIKLLL